MTRSTSDRLYEFVPVLRGYWLTRHTVRVIESALAEGRESVKVTLDLGLSTSVISLEGGAVRFPGGEELGLDELRGMREGFIYYFDGRCLKVLALSEGGRYYKLRPVGPDTAPTLEISGIHMHNIAGTTPIKDARRKVRLAGVRAGDRVLDICTGLGYTAILSRKIGAKVLSVEKDPNVLMMARYNPWSRGLVDVNIILGDAAEVVEYVDGPFDRIIHDPPRFALAGELYGYEFYSKLYRVLRPGGILFHYTGYPGKRRGVDVQRGVATRLRRSGFEVVRVIRGYCIVARKTL